PGKSINLGNVALESSRTTTPSFTFALNSLLPGEAQRGHRHNAVAVTLVLAGERCYSLIDGERADWERHTVMITPPTAFHSHHNDGSELALFLIVQDGGVYYHCRTMGFSYKEPAQRGTRAARRESNWTAGSRWLPARTRGVKLTAGRAGADRGTSASAARARRGSSHPERGRSRRV